MMPGGEFWTSDAENAKRVRDESDCLWENWETKTNAILMPDGKPPDRAPSPAVLSEQAISNLIPPLPIGSTIAEIFVTFAT